MTPSAQAFYCRSLGLLHESGVQFLVGGAYALACYTGIERHTKDLDLFVRRDDLGPAMEVLRAGGCRTELTFPHWLGKAYCGEEFIDLIFSSGNGIAAVDDAWFEHAAEADVLGHAVKLCPVEEIIWSKSFILERERYDGADIAHLLRACGESLDWPRLIRRFGPDWRVLLSHLVLFGFIYPAEQSKTPKWVLAELLSRLQQDMENVPPSARLCQGTLLSRAQYLIDINRWGYQDARLIPHGKMTSEEIARWTEAIGKEK